MARSKLRARFAVLLSAGALVALPLLTSPASASDDLAAAAPAPAAPHEPNACVPADKCCKVCSAGRACGNSCISASKNCHKGRGCACNEAEICGAGS